MKKKQGSPSFSLLWRLFGYTLLACIIALIYDLGKTYLSSGQKLAVKFVCAAVCVLVLLRIFGFIRRKYTLKQLDGMEGHRFEYACADILKMNGFKNVKVTQGSGDYGVDIIAYKNGKKYAVQCKRYSHKLDNKPIQEVKAGLAYYNCDIGAVMTNQYFTEPAKELARINGVKLWDRNALSKMLRKTAKDKPKNVKEKKTRKEKRPSFPPMTHDNIRPADARSHRDHRDKSERGYGLYPTQAQAGLSPCREHSQRDRIAGADRPSDRNGQRDTHNCRRSAAARHQKQDIKKLAPERYQHSEASRADTTNICSKLHKTQ